jgi:hypothetical protein
MKRGEIGMRTIAMKKYKMMKLKIRIKYKEIKLILVQL